MTVVASRAPSMRTLLIAFLFFAGTASAQELGIKDLVLGSDMVRVETEFGMQCDDGDEPGERTCYQTRGSRLHDNLLTIAGAETKSVFVSSFRGKVDSVTFWFAAEDFDRVKAAFATRHRFVCADEPVENAMGARFVQTLCGARTPKGKVRLLRREHDNLFTGQVRVWSHAYEARARHGTQRRKNQDQKDI